MSLYKCLSGVFKEESLDENNLYTLICKYMDYNRSVINSNFLLKVTYIPQYSQEYLQKIRKEGDGVVIQCFCEIFKMNVMVRYNGKRKLYRPLKGTKSIGEIELYYNDKEFRLLNTKSLV